jgi:hypothetical protein
MQATLGQSARPSSSWARRVREGFVQVIALVRQHRRAFWSCNAFYFVTVLGGMLYASFDRALQKQLLDAIGVAFFSGPLAAIGNAYTGGELAIAIVLTFVTNLVVGALLTITVPSLVVPFSGFVLGASRAVLWGLVFSPPTLQPTANQFITGVLIALVLVLEGEAYVVALLAAYLQGKALLFPKTVHAAGHWRGYWYGLKQTAALYVLIALLLAVAAVYEAFLVIVILPHLT